MYIIEDTAQKIGQHSVKNKWWASNGISVTRCHLPFGDYCLPPKVAVDTKANMSEIAQNICGTSREHIRFREECKRARDHGCKLYFLIENEDGITCMEDVTTWQNPRRFVSPKAVGGDRLAKAMATMSERYECEFVFCRPEESAERIEKILKSEGENDNKND